MGNYYNGSSEENRTAWSRTHFFSPKNGTLSDVILDTTGFVEKVAFRQTNPVNGESEKFCDVTINSYIGDSKVRRYFGEDFVRNDHRVRFKMSYRSFFAENIEKMGLKEGDIVQVMLYAMKLEEGTTEAGYVYKHVRCYTSDCLYLISRLKEKGNSRNGESAVPAENQPHRAESANGLPANQSPVQQPANTGGVCVNCGTTVDEKVAAYSAKYYGRCLCRTCQKTDGVKSQTQSTQASSASEQQPAQTLICTNCGSPIDEKVAGYSMRRMGRYLCRSCQSGAGNASVAPAAPQQPAQSGFSPVEASELFEELDDLDESNPFYS